MANFLTLFKRAAATSLLLVLLSTTSFAIALDNTFASNGKYMTTFSDVNTPSSSGSSLFIQPSGRIVAIGVHSQLGTSARTIGLGLVGLLPNGAIDTTFGTGGKLLLWSPGSNQYLFNADMFPDGSIVCLSQTWTSQTSHRPMIIKFTPNGQVDTSYNGDLEITPTEYFPVRMARSESGKVYAILRNATSTTFFMIRLNTDGTRDESFGPNGVRELNLKRFTGQPQIDNFYAIGGKLLIGGTHYGSNFETFNFLARFDSEANIDRSFGLQGVIRPQIPGGTVYANTIFPQSNGRLLLGGSWTFLGSTSLLMQILQGGRLDIGFGVRGYAQSVFNDWNSIRGIAQLPSGKLIVAGSCGDKAVPSNARVLLMVYSASGVRESSLVTNFITTREAQASDIVLQPDGKFLIVGYTQNPSDNNGQLVIARYTQ